ncbi:hypothetical protein BaRGS_00007338 [Batillaria attramentaria]|uniref:Uncharacterized protein n=1 Tax=Batillaria attramentaria TaxID=370345 RepID=A0ABD0LR86_9CAEN
MDIPDSSLLFHGLQFSALLPLQDAEQAVDLVHADKLSPFNCMSNGLVGHLEATRARLYRFPTRIYETLSPKWMQVLGSPSELRTDVLNFCRLIFVPGAGGSCQLLANPARDKRCSLDLLCILPFVLSDSVPVDGDIGNQPTTNRSLILRVVVFDIGLTNIYDYKFASA